MGIKFHCPNGHKMNVKSFLAGKKGVCPKCGVGVEVPMVSEGEAAPVAAVAAKAEKSALADTLVDDPQLPSITTAAAGEAQSTMAPASNGAATTKTAKMPAVIAQNPLAIWYTCTQAGERFGPVNGEVLNGWLEEGRVTATSLVWREGWPQWQKASAVFPSLNPAAALAELAGGAPDLGAPAAAATTAQPKLDDLMADAISSAAVSATTYISSSRRRSYKDKLVLASMVMIGAVIFLAFTLLIVLLNQ